MLERVLTDSNPAKREPVLIWLAAMELMVAETAVNWLVEMELAAMVLMANVFAIRLFVLMVMAVRDETFSISVEATVVKRLLTVSVPAEIEFTWRDERSAD